MSSSRLKNKIYKYAIIYFPNDRQLGTAPTKKVHLKFREMLKRDNKFLSTRREPQFWQFFSGAEEKNRQKWWEQRNIN